VASASAWEAPLVQRALPRSVQTGASTSSAAYSVSDLDPDPRLLLLVLVHRLVAPLMLERHLGAPLV
jgi:hypothetical protein